MVRKNCGIDINEYDYSMRVIIFELQNEQNYFERLIFLILLMPSSYISDFIILYIYIYISKQFILTRN